MYMYRGGRCGGLMVSALDSGVSGPGSSLGRGDTLQWTSIASRGEKKYSYSLHATETEISSSVMGHMARMPCI